ncbi:MAG: SPASM domain-containing protein, partial [Anaerolineales bacterium]|nr:SPASM domain-containing protein [Anaerolineales bacterium]
LVSSKKQVKFGRAKLDRLPEYCLHCEVRFACHGGCPKNRFIRTPKGKPGLNYLCQGYQAFFKHIDEAMKIMAFLLRQQRAPAEIMNILGNRKSQTRFNG